ncbi:hypothetical protein T01_15795 [Trichinella spiralis]|nr:hypothetical protein T01_15795 [Trichinella spiralis]
MAVHVSGFRAVSNDLDLFREQLQDGLTVKEHLNAVTLHLNKLKLKLLYSMTSIRQQYLEKELHDVNSCDVELATMRLFQVWLCDTENAIGNGKNVSRLQNTVKLQLSKYEWISEGMTSKKKQLVELLEKQCFICVEIRPFNGLGSRYKVALKIRSEKWKVEEGIEILNVMSGISTTDGCGIRRKYTCRRPAETLIKSLARQRALNSWLKNSDSCCRPVKTIGFREVLQKVLSVKEQLNTVTVHLHPLNLLCTSFSCIGRMVKRVCDTQRHHRLHHQVRERCTVVAAYSERYKKMRLNVNKKPACGNVKQVFKNSDSCADGSKLLNLVPFFHQLEHLYHRYDELEIEFGKTDLHLLPPVLPMLNSASGCRMNCLNSSVC